MNDLLWYGLLRLRAIWASIKLYLALLLGNKQLILESFSLLGNILWFLFYFNIIIIILAPGNNLFECSSLTRTYTCTAQTQFQFAPATVRWHHLLAQLPNSALRYKTCHFGSDDTRIQNSRFWAKFICGWVEQQARSWCPWVGREHGRQIEKTDEATSSQGTSPLYGNTVR